MHHSIWKIWFVLGANKYLERLEKDWKARSESPYSLVLKHSKITVWLSYKIPFLTFNVSNWNFLNGGGNDVEVEMRSLITVISFSVVQERSTACNGKKRKFRCSNDLIRRIDKVTSDWDCVVILQHFDRKTTAAERIGLRWYVVLFFLSCVDLTRLFNHF